MDEELSEPRKSIEEVAPPPVREVDELPPPPRSDAAETLQWIFIGPNGIRAGWSILIFFGVMLATLVPIGILVVLTHIPLSARVMTPPIALFGGVINLLLVVVPTVVMAAIERKSVLSYGFIDRKAMPRLAGGFVVGFVAISLLIGLLRLSGLIAFDRVSLGGVSILGYGSVWLLSFFLVAIFEESFFRGYLQYTLARGLNFWWAGLILSALFGIAHLSNSGESGLGVLQVTIAGLLFVLSLRLTGSLVWAVGLHAGWDWAQSFFYGVADSGVMVQGHFLAMHPIGNSLWSGGSDGPEGSPLSMVVELLIAIGIWLFWRYRLRSPFNHSEQLGGGTAGS